MSALTTLGFEYPVGTDPVASLDSIIQNLATRLDDYVGLHAAGREVVNVTALNTVITKTVNMPVDLFTVAGNIVITACIMQGSPQQFHAPLATNIALETFDLKVYRTAGTTGNITVMWHAIQTAP